VRRKLFNLAPLRQAQCGTGGREGEKASHNRATATNEIHESALSLSSKVRVGTARTTETLIPYAALTQIFDIHPAVIGIVAGGSAILCVLGRRLESAKAEAANVRRPLTRIIHHRGAAFGTEAKARREGAKNAERARAYMRNRKLVCRVRCAAHTSSYLLVFSATSAAPR
jgi:hypothetical protein